MNDYLPTIKINIRPLLNICDGHLLTVSEIPSLPYVLRDSSFKTQNPAYHIEAKSSRFYFILFENNYLVPKQHLLTFPFQISPMQYCNKALECQQNYQQ